MLLKALRSYKLCSDKNVKPWLGISVTQEKMILREIYTTILLVESVLMRSLIHFL